MTTPPFRAMNGDLDRVGPDHVAVLDIGKTNVKVSVITPAGTIAESLSLPNPVLPGPPWQHHDLSSLGDWVFDALATLSHRYPIHGIVPVGHGSAGVLVTDDPDGGNRGDGAALPMIDYEQELPAQIRDGYAPLAGSFHDRGSTIMLKATHQARQLFWMQQCEPQAFAHAAHYLCLPQYWAWRLSGTAVCELTALSAQSHLWNVIESRWSPLVENRCWTRLMPPMARAWHDLGPIRKALARRYGIDPDTRVLAGGHDSSLNLYRYQACGMPDACVVSTGTWIVGLCAATPLERIDEARGMVLNSDVTGRTVGGSLTMGGREFSLVAGDQQNAEPADPITLNRLIERDSFALPSFGDDDGLFRGSARQGRIHGPPVGTDTERKALAVLYSALLTVECIDALASDGMVVLDGSFLKDPLYASLIATLLPACRIVYNLDAYGIASGAALLAGHGQRQAPATIALERPLPFGGNPAALSAYARKWRALATTRATGPPTG